MLMTFDRWLGIDTDSAITTEIIISFLFLYFHLETMETTCISPMAVDNHQDE